MSAEGFPPRPLPGEDSIVLYRPVGMAERNLVQRTAWREFPPRLPEQPIFYPVMNEAYATQIARDWNTKGGGTGYVLRFRVRAGFLERYVVRRVGGDQHLELWVPAAELPEFNSNIVGRIEVVSEWHGEPPVSKSPDLDGAHRHCGLNRNEIARSANCGCFYCVATFAPSEIHEWVDVHDGLEEGPARLGEKGTALCPRCGIDAVLGSASGLPVGDTDFLRRMNGRWFS